LVVLVCGAAVAAEVPAFPGAEGFGAVATGGRGGRVIRVTTLRPRGPGSLNAAVQAKGPRIVVFDVSGVIRGNVTITESDLTIAGQTAPGAGITIEGILATKYLIKPPVKNVIIRHVRVRPPRPRGRSHGGDCFQITNVDRLMIDHCSCSWANDECVDLCGSRRLTVQWCTIEESDPVGHGKGYAHNFGMIIAYGSRDATIHHNLFAHHSKRAPLVGVDVLDHRNNVLYNMSLPFIFHPPKNNRRRGGKPWRMNVVGNVFKSGPDVKWKLKGRTFDGLFWKPPSVEPYVEGNVCTWLGKGKTTYRPKQQVDTPWPAPKVDTQTAREAYELVLKKAGCWPRDAVSKRTVHEVRKGTGSWKRREPAGGLMAGLEPQQPPQDTDRDGLPDDWEVAHKLDCADPDDAAAIVPNGASQNDRHAGYTYIEFYVNELADRLVPPDRN
jgi:pectate lyase